MVTVAGACVTPFGRGNSGKTFRDLAGEAFGGALTVAGLEPRDIDTLIVSSESDVFTLQLNPATLLAQTLGLHGAAAMRVEGGGASGQLAVQAGAARILAGLSRRVAIIGADMAASSLSAKTIRMLYTRSLDAMTDGPTGITATQYYALSWQAFAATHSLGQEDLSQVTIAFRAQAQANPGAHLPRHHSPEEIAQSPVIAFPYHRLHCSPLSDGAAAVILCHPSAVPSHRADAASIIGMGAATDVAFVARPDPGHFAAKSRAMKEACQMAGITQGAIELAEIYDPYAGAALQSLHALGLSERPGPEFQAGRFGRDGALPVNLSGGLMGQGAPPGAVGVAQVAACAMLLEGRYHADAQPQRTPRYALADTHGGICSNAAVTILERRASAR